MADHKRPPVSEMPDRRDQILKIVGMTGGPAGTSVAGAAIGTGFTDGTIHWPLVWVGLGAFVVSWLILKWRCGDGYLRAMYHRMERESCRRCECGCRGELDRIRQREEADRG